MFSEGVCGKVGIFHNGKNPIEVFFPLEDGISFAYCLGMSMIKHHGYHQEKRVSGRGQGWRQSSSGQDPRVGAPHTVSIYKKLGLYPRH